MTTQDRIGTIVGIITLACLVQLAVASACRAALVPIRLANPAGHARAYEAVSVCDASGCQRLPLSPTCAPGATCELVADLAAGTRDVWLLGHAGDLTTAASNVRTLTVEAAPPPFDAAVCLADDACRADFDGSGTVTITDFGRLLRVLGSSWP